MRTREPIRVVCDGPGCGRVGDGWRETSAVVGGPQGQVQSISRIVPPQGWRVAFARPALQMPAPQDASVLFLPAQETATRAGVVVEGAFCTKCQPKLAFEPAPAEPTETHEVPSDADVDPRQAERDAEKARVEAEAEAAERAAFEAKRQQAAQGGA